MNIENSPNAMLALWQEPDAMEKLFSYKFMILSAVKYP